LILTRVAFGSSPGSSSRTPRVWQRPIRGRRGSSEHGVDAPDSSFSFRNSRG
jgi:hypothetical protein